MRLTTLLFSFVLSISFACLPSRGDAQATASVSIAGLTVDGNPPPGEYRELMRTALQPTLRPVLECYQDVLRTTPTKQGSLRLRLWVSAREVIRATEEASTLGDDAFDECARARVRLFRLPDAAPMGGASVIFTLYFARTGIAAVPAPSDVVARVEGPLPSAAPPPPVTPAPPPLVATVPPVTTAPFAPRASFRVDAITGPTAAETLLAALPGTLLDACPPAVGDRVLTLTIARAGTVRATAGRGTLRDRAIFGCVMRAVRGVVLPSARRSTRATVTVTLTR